MAQQHPQPSKEPCQEREERRLGNQFQCHEGHQEALSKSKDVKVEAADERGIKEEEEADMNEDNDEDVKVKSYFDDDAIFYDANDDDEQA